MNVYKNAKFVERKALSEITERDFMRHRDCRLQPSAGQNHGKNLLATAIFPSFLVFNTFK